jgi:hypothetical protein
MAKNKTNKRTKKRPDLADALVKAAKATVDARIPSDDLVSRARLAKASRPGQIEYLHQMSPAAAAAWEAGQAA